MIHCAPYFGADLLRVGGSLLSWWDVGQRYRLCGGTCSGAIAVGGEAVLLQYVTCPECLVNFDLALDFGLIKLVGVLNRVDWSSTSIAIGGRTSALSTAVFEENSMWPRNWGEMTEDYTYERPHVQKAVRMKQRGGKIFSSGAPRR